MKDEIQILETIKNLDDLLHLFNISGFSRLKERRKDNIKAILDNSQKYIAAYDGPKIIGFIRVLTDFQTIGYISDLCVDPDYRKDGIGGHLLDIMIDYCDKNGIPVLNLLDSSGITGFYKKHGFKTEEEINGMYRINPKYKKT